MLTIRLKCAGAGEKVEQDILKLIPKEYYKDVNHLLVWHGRKICNARKPKCSECPIRKYCRYYLKGNSKHYTKQEI